MEEAGLVLVAAATLVLGLAALTGPLKNVAMAWLTVEVVTIATAMISQSQIASLAAATALVMGVPVAGVVVVAWKKGVDHGNAR